MGTHYDADFCQWTQEQATLLRAGLLSDVDAMNLAEEIESMGNSDRRSLGSHLTVVMMHLLKWRYQQTHQCNSWRLSIHYGRNDIEQLLSESPSLKNRVTELVEKRYPYARRNAVIETGLPLSTFPETCPFTIDQILCDYWPS